jgi:hypothetical protein
MGYWCPPQSSKLLETCVPGLVGSIPTQSRQPLHINGCGHSTYYEAILDYFLFLTSGAKLVPYDSYNLYIIIFKYFNTLFLKRRKDVTSALLHVHKLFFNYNCNILYLYLTLFIHVSGLSNRHSSIIKVEEVEKSLFVIKSYEYQQLLILTVG